MKRPLLIGLGIAAGVFLLFGLCVLVVSTLFGEKLQFGTGAKVGLVEVKGIIIDSRDITRQLIDLGKDGRVRAVVLRIDSPGGVVGPSQEIYEEVKKLNATKKVVVSMGSLAASGGYYVAAPASVIYANPGTITGSIGVLIKFTNFEQLMDKVGMKMTTVKSGEFKDVGSPARPMTDAEKQMIQSVIDSSYGQFVQAVATGRHMKVEDVKSIADGRILSGEQAQKLHLVDKLGDFQDAVAEAGRLAGISGEPELVTPPKKKGKLVDLLVEESAAKISQAVRKEILPFSLNYELGM